MKRWIAGIAAAGLVLGVAGPVAAKAASSNAPRAAAVKSASPNPTPKAAAAPVIAPKHHGGSYPGPNLPKVVTDPSTPRANRYFKVKVEYFCTRGSVQVDIAPSQSGWPVYVTTDRYGKGYVRVNAGLPRGNYTLTATCNTDTATKSFRVK